MTDPPYFQPHVADKAILKLKICYSNFLSHANGSGVLSGVVIGQGE